MTRLRAGLDITPLVGVRTGIGWWVQELVHALAALGDPELELTGYAVTWRGRDVDASLPTGMTRNRLPMAARPLHAAWGRVALPPVELWTGPLDVVHATNFVAPPARRAGVLVTIHDLTAWRFPSMVAAATLAVPNLVARAVARGAHVHTNSRFVAAEVTEALGVPSDRVHVVSPGVPVVDAAVPGRGRQIAGCDRYLLALGTIEPRKDLPSLVAAFDRVAGDDPDVRLVVAGAEGWGIEAFDAALRRMHHRDRVLRPGYVSAADRAALLRDAALFVYPSLYEGFGFPPLEAMVAGVAVVATTAGSLPEVLGDAALLTPPGDVDALAGSLAHVLADDREREDLVRRGAARAAQLSWESCASGMVDVYRSVAR